MESMANTWDASRCAMAAAGLHQGIESFRARQPSLASCYQGHKDEVNVFVSSIAGELRQPVEQTITGPGSTSRPTSRGADH